MPFQADAEQIALVWWSRGSGTLAPPVCPDSHPSTFCPGELHMAELEISYSGCHR